MEALYHGTAKNPPNIILIIMDAAGAKRCSVYGHQRPTTPGLAKIAAEGALYRHCFTPSPWTIPSHTSLFSGLYPSEHNCDDKANLLPEVFHCLPEILQQLGYRTVAISSNGLLNLQRGFDVFYEMDTLIFSDAYHEVRMAVGAAKKEIESEWGRFKLILKLAREHNLWSYPFLDVINRLYRRYSCGNYERSYPATERSVRICKKLLQKYQGSQPLFIFINLMDTHYKYNPPQECHNIINIRTKEKKAILQFDPYGYFIAKPSHETFEKLTLLYEQALSYVDGKIFELYQFITEQGLKDRTLFIVTSDHGELLGEHDIYGHSFSVYNEVLHIPLVVKFPGEAGPQGDFSHLVQLQDLYATIMEMLSVPIPTSCSSQSLLSDPRQYALSEHLNPSLGVAACYRRDPNFQPPLFMQPCRCVIDQEFFKLIEWADGNLELYDLNTDFWESSNLSQIPKQASRVQALQSIMREKLGPFGKNT